ncbi:MAG: cbb3-type cytochrome oxidase assembly protein CcoS [Gammaproteobacteria bacterium]|nr:cbb3-type cytochrome oxidase assembly protein CcoS [Gammaproteobacteria bacterium]
MEVIYGLIPGMIILGLIMVGVLVWAVKQGQYDDMEGEANRILMDDDDPLLPQNETGKKDNRNWPDAD